MSPPAPKIVLDQWEFVENWQGHSTSYSQLIGNFGRIQLIRWRHYNVIKLKNCQIYCLWGNLCWKWNKDKLTRFSPSPLLYYSFSMQAWCLMTFPDSYFVRKLKSLMTSLLQTVSFNQKSTMCCLKMLWRHCITQSYAFWIPFVG